MSSPKVANLLVLRSRPDAEHDHLAIPFAPEVGERQDSVLFIDLEEDSARPFQLPAEPFFRVRDEFILVPVGFIHMAD